MTLKNDDIQIGFVSFEHAKACSPFKEMLFRKYDRTDPTLQDARYFNNNPQLVQFAKFAPIEKEDPEKKKKVEQEKKAKKKK